MRGFVLVAIGGAAGSGARWGIAEVLPRSHAEFPWATLIVNVVGCLAIGLAARHLRRGSERWLLLVTGGLGGFTTFSAFAVEARELIDTDHALLAAVYVAASVVLGLAATALARPRAAEATS